MPPPEVPAVRAPRVEELARIEAARAVLRGAARQLVVVAFGLPSVIAAVGVVFALCTYPGDGSEKMLVTVAGTAASASVLMLLVVLLTHQGRPWRVWRRLRADAASGFLVATSWGEVSWSPGSDCYVA
jgi:formate-dependent nitrite reductase membrane component NrfD